MYSDSPNKENVFNVWTKAQKLIPSSMISGDTPERRLESVRWKSKVMQNGTDVSWIKIFHFCDKSHQNWTHTYPWLDSILNFQSTFCCLILNLLSWHLVGMVAQVGKTIAISYRSRFYSVIYQYTHHHPMCVMSDKWLVKLLYFPWQWVYLTFWPLKNNHALSLARLFPHLPQCCCRIDWFGLLSQIRLCNPSVHIGNPTWLPSYSRQDSKKS